MIETQERQRQLGLAAGWQLAMSAGLMDAYSYLCRGKVFANAQTGNILLLAVNLARGHVETAVQYLIPVMSFALGVAAASLIRHLLQGRSRKIRNRSVLLLVGTGLFFSALFPARMNWAANSIISFVCAVQLESFPQMCGIPVATTMCIGNLRSTVHNFLEFCYEGKKEALYNTGIYLSVIVLFALGAILGDFLIAKVGEKAIWGSCVIVMACFAMEGNYKEPGV